MRPIPSIIKNFIIIIVLISAFTTSTLIAVLASVNLSVPVQNSNRDLDDWVKTLQNKGFSLFYSNFNPTGPSIKAESYTAFEKLLHDHQMTEAMWHWTELAFPYNIVYGKIWFVDKGTTYYLETSY